MILQVYARPRSTTPRHDSTTNKQLSKRTKPLSHHSTGRSHAHNRPFKSRLHGVLRCPISWLTASLVPSSSFCSPSKHTKKMHCSIHPCIHPPIPNCEVRMQPRSSSLLELLRSILAPEPKVTRGYDIDVLRSRQSGARSSGQFRLLRYLPLTRNQHTRTQTPLFVVVQPVNNAVDAI